MSDQPPPPPAWDGDGPDPWMPSRLAAWYDAARVEAAMFRSFLGFLRDWITLVRDRWRAHRYDPTVVQSVAVAWWDAMNEFGSEQLYPAAEAAYLETTGETRMPVDMVALTRARVAQRVNQLRDLPNEVYTMVQGLVDRSVTEGWSIERLAAALEELFDFTATPRWENRATVVARTEAIGALNGGRNDGFAQVAAQLGGTFEKMWIATADTRTRASHRQAEGQRVAIGAAFAVGESMLAYPGDPAGPPEEVIQCRCTTVLVRPGQTLDLSRRRS